MGSQTSTARHQALSDAHQTGIPGLVGVPISASGLHRFLPSGPYRLQNAGRQGPLEGGGYPPLDENCVAPLPEEEKPNADEKVPCLFTWTGGGHEVFLTGSFNQWSTEDKVKMQRCGHEFSTIQELPRGVHRYKFIVDNQWKYASDQQTQSDEHGNINNVIDLSDYLPYIFHVPSFESYQQYTQGIPEVSDFSADAPTIPILLGKSQSIASEPPPHKSSSIPLHSLSNRIYHDTVAQSLLGSNVSCVAVTQRWTCPNNSYSPQRYSTFMYLTLNPLCPPASSSSKSGGSLGYADVNPLKHILRAPTPEGEGQKELGGTSTS